MKKYTIIAIISIGLILGFFTGIYLYRINSIDDDKIVSQIDEDNYIKITQLSNDELIDLVETNNKEEKTSPNCVINLKVYYKDCEHLIETRKNIEEAYVNMTEEEIRERFIEWELQKFVPTEIALYKEIDEFCNQHFLLKEEEGRIVIYKLNENENQEFLQKTDIFTEYLPEEDLEQIKNGIKIYTEKELNKILEDFE